MTFIFDTQFDVLPSRYGGAIPHQICVQLSVRRHNLDIAALGHGIPGVHHEVHNHLFKLSLVRFDGTQSFIMHKSKANLLSNQTIQKMCQVGKRIAQINPLRLQVLFA